ncbi:ABC transporter substrate-binding protein [Streptomyces sp. NPDC059740]|uniref:ABC transporter substrate-binding protein n=1 Tax=Streptomyces sp. NPDC059740 TaxID=3346926 RepID=UPI00364E6127
MAPLLLAGCSGGASGGGGTAAGSPVHIRFWSALRGAAQVVDAFNRTHHDVQVDFEQIPGGDQGGYAKLSTAARAGNAPDVATIEYPQLPGFAIDGVTRDLTPLISDRLRRQILPQALALTTFDHRTYSVPLDVEPMVFLYRRDVFTAHHIKVPTTWAEFRRAAQQVKAAVPGSRIVNLPTDGGAVIAGLAWQAGARWFRTDGGTWRVSMTDAPTRRVAAYWQRMEADGLVLHNAGTGQHATAQFARGEVLGKLTAAWDAGGMMGAAPQMKGKWAIAPMPQWDPDHPAVGVFGGSTFAVTRDSEHPRAAMEFIDWQVTSPEAMRARLSSGVSSAYPVVPALLPVCRKTMDTSYYGGQDIYALFHRQAALISDQWTWGPRMSATTRVIQDGLARSDGRAGGITDALRNAQHATMSDLKSLGLATGESDS